MTEKPIQDNDKKAKPQQSRRVFLQKSALGASLVTIPAQSVWAGRLVSGAISGGQSWAGGPSIVLALRSPGYFKNNNTISAAISAVPFNSIFPGGPFRHADRPIIPADTTLLEILQNPGNGGGGGKNGLGGGNQEKLGGPSNVNVFLVCMYLNALYHNPFSSHGITWPVVDNGLFANAEDYASYLYGLATADPDGVGSNLSQVVCINHLKEGDTDQCPTS